MPRTPSAPVKPSTPAATAPLPRALQSWDALRLFLCVVDQGSLSKACEVLELSQSTLTRQISALEASLGVALFERTPRGMALTAVAQTLVEPVRAMHAQALAVSRLTQGLDDSLQGVVRVSASEMVAMHLLPAMLAVLRQQSPAIDLVLLATDRMSNLVEREADIAVRNIRPTEDGLVARKVAELPVGIYASTGYLASHRAPRGMGDLSGHEFVVAFQHLDGFRASLASAGVAADALHVAVTTNSHATAWGLVRAGVGLGFAPVCIGAREPGVQRVMPEAPTPVLPVWLTVHQEVKANARLRRVYDFLAERFAALG